MSFIKRHHNIEQVLFWPNLASSHCAAIAMNFLEEKTPQGRPIETVWEILED